MEIKKEFSFSNNGKPYKIILDGSSSEIGIELYDGNLHVYDDNVLSVKLQIEEIETGIIFRRTKRNYFIALEYKLTYFGEAHKKRFQSSQVKYLLQMKFVNKQPKCSKKYGKRKKNIAKNKMKNFLKLKKKILLMLLILMENL